MALDNPSYFTVAAGPSENDDFLKKSTKISSIDSQSTSSESSINRSPMRLPRSYLRSISTNSADSNQELLIMGEPRLSDIAPDLTFKLPGEPRRSNSLKFTRTDQNGQYFPLPTSEVVDVDDQDDDDEEVFLTENTARYYNLSQNSVTRRRHSIGTMMARERSVSSATCPSPNFKDEFPHVVVHTTPEGNSIGPINSIVLDDHSMRHSSYPRKRCVRCRVPNKKLSDMDDILIISVKSNEPANMWANYFTTCFQQFGYHQITKRSFKIHHLDLDEIIEANGDLRFISEKTVTVKLQLVVICPLFLDRLNKNLAKVTPLSKFLNTNRVLALLLGVNDADITESHKTVLTTYTQWQRHTHPGEDQDESFTKEFLGSAMMIYMRTWKQQVSLSNQEKSHFSVSPKKVRQGQNSVLIVLTHPLQKEDIVKISIERNNEIVEIKSFKIRNPYTLKISIPEAMTEVSAIVNVLVEKNGSIIGSRPIKCESKLRELEQILRSTSSPVEFMCQTMGVSTHDKCQLDNQMVNTFQKNLPPNFNLLSDIHPIERIRQAGCEQFPTLLHFAAKFGLEKFAMQLVDCPGGDLACEIKNVADCNPSDIAEAEGYSDLAQMLRGYMNMNEFSKMYTKLKQISLNPGSIDEVDEEDYLVPREANFYKLCPAPRPVISPLASPQSDISQEALHNQYLSMTSKKSHQTSQESIQKEKAPHVQRLTSATSTSNISVTSSVKSTATSTTDEDKVQQELLEIINDFKKDIHSIEQTEKLVQQWKKRNDVQMSYKEKKDQLTEMRKKYEEIQQLLKVEKKPSPFERIGKFFSRRKQKSVKQLEKEQVALHPITNRPISSLSIQSTSSSGSSGRMSTISGCSLGDSGTHSDHEDRKNLIGNVSDDDFRQLDMFRKMKESNYLVPPAPKPVLPTPIINRTISTPIIDERPPQPIPRDVTEYYIQFPPSGLPVQQFHQNHQQQLSNVTETPEDNVYIQFEEQSQQSSPTAEYMNFSPLDKQQSIGREYMNLGPVNAQQHSDLPEYMNLTPQN